MMKHWIYYRIQEAPSICSVNTDLDYTYMFALRVYYNHGDLVSYYCGHCDYGNHS